MTGFMIAMNKEEIILDGLRFLFPSPKCELIYNKDYELLLSTMLSAQTTDKRVNLVTSEIYKKYDSLEKLNNLSVKEIEEMIKTIGMYKTKAKNFKGIVSSLLELGYFPSDRNILESLPGVGRKTTNVVLANLFGEKVIAVDTHVLRVSKRLGLAKESDGPLEVEKKITNRFSKYDMDGLHNRLVLFGRYKCTSRNPLCTECPFKEICKYYKKCIKK